jgi:carbamoyl-phosphate synthase small subunit
LLRSGFSGKNNFCGNGKWEPHGYFISNGPGDPSVMDYAIKTVKEILNLINPFLGFASVNNY